MINRIISLAGQQTVCILGFGAEGQSSLRLLQQVFPAEQILIADRNPSLPEHPLLKDKGFRVQCGQDYLQGLERCGLILKSPGIPFTELSHLPAERISSQAEIFIEKFARQIIGITGTKGKSTTSSLIFHIIRQHTNDVLLVGNIGVPPFDEADKIDSETLIVYELSSHQLERIRFAPHTSLLLNLYEEHLDHYGSREDYFMAKMNIGLQQHSGDVFIYNAGDSETGELMRKHTLPGRMLPVSTDPVEGAGIFQNGDELIFQSSGGTRTVFDAHRHTALKGQHNTVNIMFAIAACLENKVPFAAIDQGIRSFEPLAHRLQYVGTYHGIRFYNDSISTIPEATMAAVKAIPDVGTLILGGFDRGIDYRGLADFLRSAPIDNLIFLGAAGRRIMELLTQSGLTGSCMTEVANLQEAVALAKKQTAPGKVCLLSPAAASYDMFKNFEERGTVFMQLVSS